ENAGRWCELDALCRRALRDRHFSAEVDVLDRLEEAGAFLHRTLERLAAADEAHAAGALVDDGGRDGFAEVVLTGSAAAVDEGDAARVGVHDLVAAEVD